MAEGSAQYVCTHFFFFLAHVTHIAGHLLLGANLQQRTVSTSIPFSSNNNTKKGERKREK